MLTKIQLQEINYLADTVIYTKAMELTKKMDFIISKSQLGKLLLFIDNSNRGYSDERGSGVIVAYLSHQIEKDTLKEGEKTFYRELYAFIKNNVIEKEVINNNSIFSDCIQQKDDPKKVKKGKREKLKLINDLLIKPFLISVINELRLKGVRSGAKSKT